MRRKALAEAIARYVESADEAAAQAISTLGSREGEQLESLFALIAKLRAILVPVEPPAEFHDALKSKLIANWHEQRRAELARNSQQRPFPWRVAAVGSFLSLAALAAVVVRGRVKVARPRPVTASS